MADHPSVHNGENETPKALNRSNTDVPSPLKKKHDGKHQKRKHKTKYKKNKEKDKDDQEKKPTDEDEAKSDTNTTQSPSKEPINPPPATPSTPPPQVLKAKPTPSKKASPFSGMKKKRAKNDDRKDGNDDEEEDDDHGSAKNTPKSKNITGEFGLECSDEDDDFDAEKEAKRLRKLGKKIERDREEFSKLKTLVEKSHRVKLDRKAAQHENNIKKLDSVISDNRKVITETVTELEKLHQSELEAKLMEAQFEKEIWEMERDVQLDKIILEKMELQKVQDRIKVLEDLQMDRLASLEAVEDERKRRTYEQENKLEILLGKIPHLTTGLEESEVKKAFDAKEIMGEYGDENEDAVYRAGDASKKIREEKYKEMVAEMQKERVQWVEEKAKLEKDMEKLEEERRVAVRRMRKGKEWLVKVELGEEKGEVGREKGDDVGAVDVFEGLVEKKTEEKTKEGDDEEKKDGDANSDADANKDPADADSNANKETTPDSTPTPLPPKPTEPTYDDLDYKAILTSFYEKYAPKKLKDVEKTLSKKKTPEDLEKEFARLAKKYNCSDPLVEAKSEFEEKVKKQKDDWQNDVEEWEKKVKEIKDEKDSKKKEAERDKEKEEKKEEDNGEDTKDDTKAPSPPIPPHLLEVTSKVALQIPVSSSHVSALQSEIAKLEEEYEWVEASKAQAWEEAQERLEKLSLEEITRLRKGFKAELASFAHVAEGREIRARRIERDREVMKCAIDIVEETVKSFAKGIYNEILGVTRFTAGHAKEAIMSALGTRSGIAGEEWEQGMWGRCFDQIVKERKKHDHKIHGETGVRRNQRLRGHFIDGKVAHKEIKRVKYEDLNVPDAKKWGRKTVRTGWTHSSPEFKQLETEYWNSVEVKSNKIKMPTGIGGVSAVATRGHRQYDGARGWREGCMMAVGTTKGAVLVYRIGEEGKQEPELLRSVNSLPSKLKRPVLDMSFAYDATSQLITLNEGTSSQARIVRLWSLSVQPDPKDFTTHSKDAFGKTFSPTIPGVSLQIDGEDGMKVGYVDRSLKKVMLDAWNDDESKAGFFGGKSKKVKEKELKEMKLVYSQNFSKEDSEPNAIAMHGSSTLLGIQPSVIVGTRGGCVYKWNNVEAKGTPVPQNGHGIVTAEKVLLGGSLADVEPGNPSSKVETMRDIKVIGKKKGGVVRREYFEFHKASIIFVGDFGEGDKAGFVSVDSNGGYARWVESKDLWSQHGWWEPQFATMWDLRVGGEEGAIIECRKAEGRREVFVMAKYAGGKFRVWAWNIDVARFLPQYVEHNARAGSRGDEPSFSLFPVFYNLGCDYIAITADGKVTVYSMVTGQEVKRGSFGREVNGSLLGCSVGMKGKVIVYSTPDIPKHLVIDRLNFDRVEGEDGEGLRRRLQEKGRGGRQGSCGMEMMGGWTGGLGYKEWCRGWVYEAAEEAMVESEEKKEKEEGEKVEEKEEGDKDEGNGEEGWLGDGDLGTVEPKRLEDLPKKGKNVGGGKVT